MEVAPKRRNRNIIVVVIIIVIILIALVALTYYYAIIQKTDGTTSTVITAHSDTFLSSCTIVGAGGLELRIVSDSTGTLVQDATITAVLRTADTCDNHSETQVVYVSNFTRGQDGWLSPILPDKATSAGDYNFVIQYTGKTYNFSATIQPISWTCVTLKVPSGNVTAPFQQDGSSCPSQAS